jgi:sodium/hydrogen exchanger 8
MDFMLPPIVFNAGYTMRKKKFFDNLGNIGMNGLCVTILCFIIYGLGGIWMISLDMKMINYYDDRQLGESTEKNINITTFQALLFAGLLCSSDVVAAVSIVDYE